MLKPNGSQPVQDHHNMPYRDLLMVLGTTGKKEDTEEILMRIDNIFKEISNDKDSSLMENKEEVQKIQRNRIAYDLNLKAKQLIRKRNYDDACIILQRLELICFKNKLFNELGNVYNIMAIFNRRVKDFENGLQVKILYYSFHIFIYFFINTK